MFKLPYLVILFLAVLGLLYCAGTCLVLESGGYSLLLFPGFSLQWLLSLHITGSRAWASVVMVLRSCGSWALEHSCGAWA